MTLKAIFVKKRTRDTLLGFSIFQKIYVYIHASIGKSYIRFDDSGLQEGQFPRRCVLWTFSNFYLQHF